MDNQAGGTYIFPMQNLKTRFLAYYEKHETRVDAGFFLGGFLFDVLTLSSVDDTLALAQQVLYLNVIGAILWMEFLVQGGHPPPLPRWSKLWELRQLVVHFLLGSLLSVYSLFLLKSSSLFSTGIFVFALMAIMVANELKRVQQASVDLRAGLYVGCLGLFFGIMYPLLLGFVGWTPFLLALATTGLVVWMGYRGIVKLTGDTQLARRRWALPGGVVVASAFVCYLMGWIPPVPLSLSDVGIYHRITKDGDQFLLHHEKPRWRFWESGDQQFRAAPGDAIHVYAQVSSPARFDDTVILHWQFKDPQAGWSTTDRIPMRVSGGRTEGYRGHAFKQNFTPGDWRVKVETTDGREIGRIHTTVSLIEDPGPDRTFQIETR